MSNTENTKPKTSVKVKRVSPKGKIEELQKQVNEYKDKYLREVAEVENYKKRIQQERINERKYAAGNFILELLGPYEQFSMICDMPTEHELLKNYLIGFKMIKDQITTILTNEGVKEIEALNVPFDPKFHHAVEKDHNPDLPNGVVTSVLQKGFMYKEKLLRPAMVKVNEWSEQNGQN